MSEQCECGRGEAVAEIQDHPACAECVAEWNEDVRNINAIIGRLSAGRPNLYQVITPEFTVYRSYGYDPPEHGRDSRLVRTTTAKRAKVLAVRSWRRQH